jgi:NitT/TauT family transport system permease protein
MTEDTESGMGYITQVAAQKPVAPAARRWRRFRSIAMVLVTQVALLAVLLGWRCCSPSWWAGLSAA